MTVKEARRLLGKEVADATDVELQSDIETAELLKNLFFDHIVANRKEKTEMAIQNHSDVP